MKRGGGVAIWSQIEAVMESEIRNGAHEPGARLPTEAALARRFEVNRHTVRRALASLEQKGMLRVEQGRGTFVQDHVFDYFVRRRTRFHEILAEQGIHGSGRILKVETLPAPPEVAAALGMRRPGPVAMVVSVGEADGRPVSMASHYFPASRVPGIAVAFEGTDSVSEALRRCGVEDFTRQTTRVTARMPTVDEARILRQPANRPVIQTEAINIDERGRPIEYGVARFAGDRVQLVFES
jgi:GntR family phosphonate transport system transcriptional regulator